MDTALLAARLILAAVFASAGLAKILDRAGAKKTIVEFGVPVTLARSLSILVPLLELTTAALLVPAWSAWWGALSGLVLLLLFTAAIAINLARGRTPNCRCFGKLHSERIGWRTLMRNAALVAVAGYVIWRGHENAGPSAVAWVGGFSEAQVLWLLLSVIAVAALVEWWFLVQLFRQQGRLLLRIDALDRILTTGGAMPPQSHLAPAGLPVGRRAPSFRLPNLAGDLVSLDDLIRGEKPLILVFVDSGCGPCTALVPALFLWHHKYRETITFVLVSRGTQEENIAIIAGHRGIDMLLQKGQESAEAYRAFGTPAAVLIHSDGTIGSPVAMGAAAIEHLVMTSAAKFTLREISRDTAFAAAT